MQNSNPTTTSNDNSQNQNSTMPSNNIDDLLRVGSNAIDTMATIPVVEAVVTPPVEQPAPVMVDVPVVQPTTVEPVLEMVTPQVVESPMLNVEVVPDIPVNTISTAQPVENIDPNQLAQSVEAPKEDIAQSPVEVTQIPVEVPQPVIEASPVKPMETVASPAIPDQAQVENNPITNSTFTPGPTLDSPMPGMQENTVNVQNLNVTDIMDTQIKNEEPIVEAKLDIPAEPVEAVRQVPTEVNPQLNGIFDAVPSEVNIAPTTNTEIPSNITVENNITSDMPALGAQVNSNSLPSIETINPVINTVSKPKGGFSFVRFILWTVILLLGILSLVIGFYFAKLVQIPFLDTLFQS
jgi:hypothetical protein